MNKKILIITFFIVVSAIVNAGNTPKDVVASFGKALSTWCQTGSPQYRKEVEKLCDGKIKCRVEDKIHADYQIKQGLMDYETFVLDSYLNMFETLMSAGIRFNMSNITVETQDHYPDGQTLTFITADIRVSGKLNYTVKDLFLVRDDKISGIYSYSSQLGFQHLNGSLIEALQREKYWIPVDDWGLSYSVFRNGYVVIGGSDGMGLINTKGEEIIPCHWDNVFYGGGPLVQVLYSDGDGDSFFTYDRRLSGKIVHPLTCRYLGTYGSKDFADGYLAVSNDVGWGFLRETDMEYNIRFIYDFATQFHEGYSYVRINGVEAIINKNLEIVVQSNSMYIICDSFYEGLARIRDAKTDKMGFINTKGEIVIPCTFDEVGNFSEGLCEVFDYKYLRASNGVREASRSDRFGYIDKTGKIVIPMDFEDYDGRSVIWSRSFKDGYVDIHKDTTPHQATLIGKNGDPLPGFSWYEDIDRFEDGLARYKKNGLYGYLRRNGSVAIKPVFEHAFDFKNGFACVGKEINNETKWGCINKDGILVIPYIYDSHFEFENGIALARRNGETCLIDVFGNSSIVVSR